MHREGHAIIKKTTATQAGREQFTPYQSKNHSLTIPTYRKKEVKRKTAKDKRERAALANKKPLALLLKHTIAER